MRPAVKLKSTYANGLLMACVLHYCDGLMSTTSLAIPIRNNFSFGGLVLIAFLSLRGDCTHCGSRSPENPPRQTLKAIHRTSNSNRRIAMAEPDNATAKRQTKHSWQIYDENRKLRPQVDDGLPRQSEDDQQREQFGPRGVPGKPDPAKMVPQRKKKTPSDFDPGHTG
jgi:hypothetical protein